MKKLSIFVILIFFIGAVSAQEAEVTWEGLKKQKEKSDTDITNAKKKLSYKTWLKRSDVYYNIHTFVLSGLYVGMDSKATKENPFNHVELIMNGKPGKVLNNDDGSETWVYSQIELIIKNGLLDSWEQTEFIDKNALIKSGEALLKAVQLDSKGTLKDKNTTKDKLKFIKNAIINQAITHYSTFNKDFIENNLTLTDFGKTELDIAFKYMSLGYLLSELPKNEEDTSFTSDQIEYFKGVIAYNNQKYDIAKQIFELSISKKYGEGSPYHYLAECYAKSGDSIMFINKVKTGFETYPNDEQLIIDLINYYMIRNQEKEAVAYIDIAIEKNPENPSYYSAKATIFDNRTDALLDKYNAFMEQALEHKKIAFQNRNNTSKKEAAQKLRDVELEKALDVLKQIEEDLNSAEKLYKEALDIDPKSFNAAYNIGRIYIKHTDRNLAHGEWLLKIYIKKDFARSAKFEEISKTYLKQAADKYEVAHNIDKKDRDALNVLKQIYYKLHDNENRERVEALMNNLTTNESEIN